MTLPQYFSVDVDPGIANRIEKLYEANSWAWSSKRALYHDLIRRGLVALEGDMGRTRYALEHLYDEEPVRTVDQVIADGKRILAQVEAKLADQRAASASKAPPKASLKKKGAARRAKP